MSANIHPKPEPATDVPLSVWPVAQVTAQYQRHGRYLPECSTHPGKMLPTLARRIVEEYSSPGDLVVDPMAGIGTTILEGASIGRRCIGVELERRWVDIAERNLDHVLDESRELADVRQGDARNLDEALGNEFGSVDLIVTSPPYACEVGTVDKSEWNSGKRLCRNDGLNYSENRDNIGHARGAEYLEQMRSTYSSCFEALRPGGLLVTVTKNMRRKGKLIDLAGITVGLAESVGFGYLQHNIALLCAVRDSGLVARTSFWQTTKVREARRRGWPQHVVAHEDVLVFVKPGDANA